MKKYFLISWKMVKRIQKRRKRTSQLIKRYISTENNSKEV